MHHTVIFAADLREDITVLVTWRMPTSGTLVHEAYMAQNDRLPVTGTSVHDTGCEIVSVETTMPVTLWAERALSCPYISTNY